MFSVFSPEINQTMYPGVPFEIYPGLLLGFLQEYLSLVAFLPWISVAICATISAGVPPGMPRGFPSGIALKISMIICPDIFFREPKVYLEIP